MTSNHGHSPQDGRQMHTGAGESLRTPVRPAPPPAAGSAESQARSAAPQPSQATPGPALPRPRAQRERKCTARQRGEGEGAGQAAPRAPPSLPRQQRQPHADTCGEVQRTGLSACRIPAVHVLGPHQPLDPLHVPVPAGLEELPSRLRRRAAARRLSQGGRPACAPPPHHAGPGPARRRRPSSPRRPAHSPRPSAPAALDTRRWAGRWAQRIAAEGSGGSGRGCSSASSAAGLTAQAPPHGAGTRGVRTRGKPQRGGDRGGGGGRCSVCPWSLSSWGSWAAGSERRAGAEGPRVARHCSALSWAAGVCVRRALGGAAGRTVIAAA